MRWVRFPLRTADCFRAESLRNCTVVMMSASSDCGCWRVGGATPKINGAGNYDSFEDTFGKPTPLVLPDLNDGAKAELAPSKTLP